MLKRNYLNPMEKILRVHGKGFFKSVNHPCSTDRRHFNSEGDSELKLPGLAPEASLVLLVKLGSCEIDTHRMTREESRGTLGLRVRLLHWSQAEPPCFGFVLLESSGQRQCTCLG